MQNARFPGRLFAAGRRFWRPRLISLNTLFAISALYSGIGPPSGAHRGVGRPLAAVSNAAMRRPRHPLRAGGVPASREQIKGGFYAAGGSVYSTCRWLPDDGGCPEPVRTSTSPSPEAQRANKLADSMGGVAYFSSRSLSITPGGFRGFFWRPKGRRRWAVRNSTSPFPKAPGARKLEDSRWAAAYFSHRGRPATSGFFRDPLLEDAGTSPLCNPDFDFLTP